MSNGTKKENDKERQDDSPSQDDDWKIESPPVDPQEIQREEDVPTRDD